MEGKQKCKVANCDKDAQMIINTVGETIPCCRNHARDVIDRVKKRGYPYKVESIPPEP